MFKIKKDTTILNLVKKEKERQLNVINLIASENYVSDNVLEALGSPLTNKYSEGYPFKRYYAGNQIIDKIETICQQRALKLFNLSRKKWGVNVQSYSGAIANFEIYSALLKPNDTILSMKLEMGGHLSHGHPASLVSRHWCIEEYGVDSKTEMIDYNLLYKKAKKVKPNLIVVGTSAYSRKLNYKKFSEIAKLNNSILMADIAHIAGLIVGKKHPSPFQYADVVMTTTHKTLRGPKGALIFYKKEYKKKINKTVFPGMQGGPHDHQTAAIAVALYEASTPNFKLFIKRIVENAAFLANEFKKLNWRIVANGTDTHLFMIDTMQKGITGKEACDKLEKENIIVNMNTIPFDTRSPENPSGIRIGLSALTSFGITKKELKKLAKRINMILTK